MTDGLAERIVARAAGAGAVMRATGARRDRVTLAVDAIIVGERRREEHGDIAALAESIKTYGLLHPIVIDADRRLVAGERRLRAVRLLGWPEVEVRDFGTLTDAERAEIELEENLQRKDFTPYERSKTLVALADTAREVLQEQAELRAESAQNSPGRPKESGSLRDVSARTGVPVKTIHKAQQHVETADAYPYFAGSAWKQYQVLQAREVLEKLPEDERPKAVALVTRTGVPPTSAIEILGALGLRAASEREAIYRKAESDDERDRSDALTDAANRPPMPDPRVAIVGRALDYLGKAERMFADDPMNASIGEAGMAVRAVRQRLREYRRGG